MAVGSGPGVAALSWSPGAARTPPGGTELPLKLGAMAALLLLPLCCGLGALCCVRGPAGSGPRSAALSLLGCLGGGVLLGTALLDLLPTYLGSIGGALRELRIPLQFPLPEFLLALGFLLVLVLEHAALALHERPAGAQGGGEEEEEEEDASRALLTSGAPPTPPGHPSPLRAGLLVLALVLHGALEGLALGLQEAGGAALRLCLALLLHKGLVAFGLCLQLLRGRLRRGAVVASLLLFSAASPLGAAVGAAVEAAGGGARQRLGRSVAEGLAAGAFLYVTLLEVLPRELGGGRRLRVPKVLALLGGFALVTATLFIRV